EPGGLTQLAVLAAAPVVPGAGLLLVQQFLARYAQAHARNRQPPRLGDSLIAFLAMGKAGTLLQLASRPFDRVFDGCVNLVLHGAIACPSGCHGSLQTVVHEVGLIISLPLEICPCPGGMDPLC